MSTQSRAKGQGSSIHSSRSSLLPPPSFNFHGLVNSQQGTQSQYNNDDANYLDDGSQKENVGDADMAVDKGVADDLPAASIIAPTNASPHVESPFRPKGSPLAPSSSSPIMSRPTHSARLKPTFTTPTYPRKATPPPSQDSFLNTLPDRGFIQSPPRDATLSQIAKAQTESDSPILLVAATPSASSQASGSDHEDEDADMATDSFQCAQPRPELEEDDYNGPWEDAENNPTQQPSQQSEYDYISQSTQIAEGSVQSTQPYVPTDPTLYRYIHNIIRMCPGNWRYRLVSNRGVPPDLVARMQEGDFSQPELDVSTSEALELEPTQPSCEDEYKKPVRRLQPPTRMSMFDMVETQPSYPKPESMLPPPGPGDPPMSYEEATSGLVETQPSNVESYRKPARTLPPPVCTVPTRDESLDVVPDSDPRTTSYPSPFIRSGRLLENSAIPKQAVGTSAMEEDIVPDSLEIERESQIPQVSPRKEGKPSSTEGKGKERADKSMKPPSMPTERTPTKQTSPVQNKRKREGSVGSSIVPSSILNETDQPPATDHPVTVKRAATKGRKKATPSTRKRTSRRTAKGKERQATLSEDEEDDDVSPTKREPESTLLLSSAGPSRKRQRLTSEASSVKQEGSTVSRSGKRPPPSVAVDNVRIIGHWRGDNSWYVGSITGRKSKGLCHIRFDDSSTSELALTDIRVLKLKVGDAVSIARSSTILESGEIGGAAEITEDGKVCVRLGRRDELVDTGSLRFPNKSVREYWNDRILTLEMLSSSGDAQLGLFSGYAFMVTGLEETKKAHQLAEIQSADGRVYDNWQNLIAWGGDYRQNGDWHIEKGRAKWRGAMNIQSVFLLAPKQNEKPKYLIALALGIPCVDIAWVHNSVKANRILDWRTYLLPAGVYAQRTVSQRVDLEWQKSDLGMVLENPISTKPLEDLDILCVGSELVPKKNLDARDGVHGIPFILFAMGASRVDVVKNVPPKKVLKQFDYVVFNNDSAGKEECEHGKVVVWQVLKESLLAGRLLI